VCREPRAGRLEIMNAAHQLAASLAAAGPMDPAWWLGSLGLAGVFAVLFAETATPAGLVLPGDSLLLTAGALCTAPPGGQARLSLPLVILAAFGGTACGAQAGYLIGRRAGARFHRVTAAADRGGRLLSRLGTGRALLLARFIPVVRTVISPLCGAAGIPARRFAVWQLAGAAVWTAGTTTAGYLAARSLPGLTHYLTPVIALVTAVSVVLAAVSAVRARRSGRRASGAGTRPRVGGTVRSGGPRQPPRLADSSCDREVL
jgi:membrane-associated protein